MVEKIIGNVKRDDFRLRTKYPYLKTRIFYIGDYNYGIFIENLEEYPFINFAELQKEFNERIRVIANPTKIIESLPNEYIQEIETIKDCQIAENCTGISFTKSQLLNFLQGKFNSYKIMDVVTNFKKQKFVVILDYENDIQKDSLQKELDKLDLALDFEIEKHTSTKVDNDEKATNFGDPLLNAYAQSENIIQIMAYNAQPIKLDFIKRDESLWFENIDKVYAGEFTKDNLSFYDRDKTSCFIDYTGASNIDIRNVLLMYDNVYLTIPFKDKNDLLFSKTFTKDNLFSMIEKNRIKLINIQPEERLDTDVLKEAYQINPNSVINRRALSLLSVIDLFEMSKNSIFNDIELQPIFYDITKVLSKELNISIKEIMQFMNWPKQAMRDSFERFNTNGIFAFGYIGVNNIIQDKISKVLNKDLKLEFIMTSQNIHLANALNATLYPSFLYDSTGKPQYFEAPYSCLMGSLLNFYKYARKDTIASLAEIEKLKLCKQSFVSPIDIFDVNTFIPFEEFEKYTSSPITRNKMNVLFNKLASMTLEERIKEVQDYNKKISEFQKKNKSKLILSDTANDIVCGLISSILSCTTLPIIIFSLFNSNFLKGIITRSEAFQNIKSAVNDLNNYLKNNEGKLSDIDILSQIDRVAKLK